LKFGVGYGTSGDSNDAFGTLTSHTGADPNPYLYAGEPVGALGGIYYLRARWMDPSSGRFLSVDPRDCVPQQPRTLHRYIYAGSDPANAVDPSGLQFSIAEVDVSLSIEEDLASIEGVATRGLLERVREQLARITVNSVKALQRVRQAGQQTHHLIEQRLWQRNPVLQRIWTSVDEMPGVNLSAAEHQLYTNAWRAAFPYSNQVGYIAEPTLQEIIAAAERIYANNPALFNAIFRDVVEFIL